MSQLPTLVSLLTLLLRPTKDERGLSQSTENAILLAGAVAIAGTIIAVVAAYVSDRLPG